MDILDRLRDLTGTPLLNDCFKEIQDLRHRLVEARAVATRRRNKNALLTNEIAVLKSRLGEDKPTVVCRDVRGTIRYYQGRDDDKRPTSDD